MGTVKMTVREADGVEVTECRGLRSDGRGGLKATADIGVGRTVTGKLLGEYGGRLYSCEGETLYADGVAIPCGGRVLGLCEVGGGRLLALCEGREPAYVDAAAGRVERMPRLALPRLGVQNQAINVQSLPTRKLGGTYRGGETTLDMADATTLRADYLKAYRRLVAGASALGGYIAPVLARVVLHGHGGERLLEGPPVLLVPDQEGVFGAQAAEYTLSDQGMASGAALRAVSFRPVIHRPADADAEWERWVARVSVEVSPQLHAVDAEGWCASRVTATHGQSLSLRLSAPGMSLTPPEGGSPWWRHQVGLMVGRFDVEATEVAAWDAHSLGSETVCNPRPIDGLDEQAGVSSRIYRPTSPIAAAEQALRSPHRFCAQCATTNGTVIAYGGVSPLPFEGYRAEEYAVGDSIVSALLVYPDGRCGAMELDGRRVSMQPTADGCRAFHLATTLAGISASRVAADLTAVAQTQPGAGLTATATLTDPLRLTAMAELPGEVVAMAPASRTRSNWEFGRRHFYAFTPHGIHAMMLSAEGRRLQCSEIDPRGVADRELVSAGERGVMAVCGRSLVRVAGSSVETVAEIAGAESIGSDPLHGEVWVAGGGFTRIYGSDFRRWRDAGVAATGFAHGAAHRLLVGSGAMAYTTRPEVGPCAVEWSGCMELPLRQRASSIDLRMSGEWFDGTVVLLTPSGHELTRYRLSGDCKGLSGRLPAPLRRGLRIEIRGQASADFRISEVILRVE